MAIKLNLLL